MSGPAGQYRVAWSDGKWQVVWVAEVAPDWWRWIASFSSRDRAEQFAEVENEIRSDMEPSDNHFELFEAPPKALDPVESIAEPDGRSDSISFMRARSSVGAEHSVPSREGGGSSPSVPASPVIERSGGQDWEWSAARDAELRKLCAENWTDAQIARGFGMSMSAVVNRRKHLGIKKRRGGRRPRGNSSSVAANAGEAGSRAQRRFTEMPAMNPANVKGLTAGNEALVEGRSIFPTTVVDPTDSPRLLVSGQNSRKLGSHVTKGPWKGMPIYSLTLEERATCPTTCHVYAECYGNGMPMARRHRHGPALVEKLGAEIKALSEMHPEGFVVRLHQLGDFYSNEYVTCWWMWLNEIKSLHVFGYTAHGPQSKIGLAIYEINKHFAGRCSIRYSSADSLKGGATTIDRVPESPRVPEGIVCPAQLKRTECCGTCGLCWHPNAKDETIVFVLHGRTAALRKPEPTNEKPRLTFPMGVRKINSPSEIEEAAIKTDSRHEAKQRKCLGCGREFLSEWAGNRLCNYCGGKTAGIGV